MSINLYVHIYIHMHMVMNMESQNIHDQILWNVRQTGFEAGTTCRLQHNCVTTIVKTTAIHDPASTSCVTSQTSAKTTRLQVTNTNTKVPGPQSASYKLRPGWCVLRLLLPRETCPIGIDSVAAPDWPTCQADWQNRRPPSTGSTNQREQHSMSQLSKLKRNPCGSLSLSPALDVP